MGVVEVAEGMSEVGQAQVLALINRVNRSQHTVSFNHPLGVYANVALEQTLDCSWLGARDPGKVCQVVDLI